MQSTTFPLSSSLGAGIFVTASCSSVLKSACIQTEEKKETVQDEQTLETDRQENTDGQEEKAAPLKEMEEKVAAMNEKYLRLSAEFDNYRKRTVKEKAELIKSAGEDLLSRILPVVDNFERALAFLFRFCRFLFFLCHILYLNLRITC